MTMAGLVEFEVLGAPGRMIIIEACTTFMDWEPMHTNFTSASGSFLYHDSRTRAGSQFFRIFFP